MKLTILSAIFLSSGALAADSSDIAFITKLVSDAKAHAKDYLGYVQTASSVPAEFTSLAKEVMTYKDDSYTTLISDINVNQLESFASKLPWATRLDLGGGSSGGSSSESGSESSSGSSASTSSTASESESSSGAAGSLIPVGGSFLFMLAALI
ncbi:uncharacterized protein PRCAT00002003001 [Priceomyces carsonii]|uniref:uncharacterized protein n=1 Tax=Priceomyces carsonii TaxID=28549 RepID=UPI002ED9491F|nr:unnamed protein product [Priceomyces carsonii]